MQRYIYRRFLYTLVTLVFIISTNFFLFRMMPGAPMKAIARAQKLDSSTVQYLEKLYGLDQTLLQQYITYVKHCLTFDMGLSYKYRTKVTPLLLEKMGNSIILVFASTVLAIVIGISTGLIAGWNRGKAIDLSLTGTGLFFWAMPQFWACMVGMALFAGILPIQGMRDLQLENPTFWQSFVDLIKHIILPTIINVIIFFGYNHMLTRNEVTTILTRDYIATARAKGLSTVRTTFKHVLRNASLPLLSSSSIALAFLVGGAIQTEIVFSWPGIGRLLLEATHARDYPVLQGSFYFLAIAVLCANFFTDIAYKYIDPRVEY